MCGRPYLDTMHMDCANLIMWYLSIWWFDSKTRNTVVIVRIPRSFSMICNKWINAYNARTNWCKWWMNKMMHVMQEWFFFFFFFGYIDGHSSHLPWLNHGCKIEFLQWFVRVDFFYSISQDFRDYPIYHITQIDWPIHWDELWVVLHWYQNNLWFHFS